MTSQFISTHLDQIRANFPALLGAGKHPPLYFDGPGGSQLPKMVIDAMSKYLSSGNSNMGGYNIAGKNTTHINSTARQLASVWLGANADEIVFGLNSTSLMFQISRVLARQWQAGDVIVLSDIEHYSHVSSWEQAALDKGVIVKKIPLNETGDDLDYARLDEVICPKTKLVALSLASNVIGTVVDVAKVIKQAKAVGAYVSIDAVHGAVHLPIDVKALGADFLFASAYKFGGGHLGIMYGKSDLLRALSPYKVQPASDSIPMAYEQGTQSFEAQAGFVALMHYWASLSGKTGIDKHTLDMAYQEIWSYEHQLNLLVLEQFAKRPHFQLYGKNQATERTPTFAFNILKDNQVVDGAWLSQKLGEKNIALGYGNFYAQALCQKISPTGAVLRMGCLHYTSQQDIERLFEALDDGLT